MTDYSKDEIMCLIKRLTYFNDWRQGKTEDKQPNATQIGKDINTVIKVLEDRLNQVEHPLYKVDTDGTSNLVPEPDHIRDATKLVEHDYISVMDEMAEALQHVDNWFEALKMKQDDLLCNGLEEACYNWNKATLIDGNALDFAPVKDALSKYRALKGAE